MDAVLLAGGIPRPDQPLYEESNGDAKALIDVAGKPMAQWVLDALNDSKSIERIVVIGLSSKAHLRSKKPLTYLSNQGKLLENLKAGTAKVLEQDPKARHVLFASSDIPGVTGEMVDWLVTTCSETDDDLYYNVVRREDMERRFPGSKRTYTHLKDMDVCGGDMNIARASIVDQNSEFWNKVIEARKNPAQQALLIGVDIIFKYLVHQLTIDDVIHRVADKLGLKGRAIVGPYPEIGMDVDKPHQLEIMRADLARHAHKASAPARPATSKKPAVRKTAAKAKAAPRPAKKATTRTKS